MTGNKVMTWQAMEPSRQDQTVADRSRQEQTGADRSSDRDEIVLQ